MLIAAELYWSTTDPLPYSYVLIHVHKHVSEKVTHVMYATHMNLLPLGAMLGKNIPLTDILYEVEVQRSLTL